MTDEEKNSDLVKSLALCRRRRDCMGSQPTRAEPPYFTDRHSPPPQLLTAGISWGRQNRDFPRSKRITDIIRTVLIRIREIIELWF